MIDFTSWCPGPKRYFAILPPVPPLDVLRPSGERLGTGVVLVLLAAVVGLEFLAHLGFIAELDVAQPVVQGNHGTFGPAFLVNGQLIHVEGLSNVRNTVFFSGGLDGPHIGYELVISRMFGPFLASLLSPVTADALVAMTALNVIAWVLASWAAFGIGRDSFHSERLGLALGLMVATGLGYIATAQGTKGHLLGYAYFVILFFLAGRLRIFEPGTPVRNFVAMGMANAVGGFLNNVFLPFAVAVLAIGIIRRAPVRWLLLVAVIPFVVTAVLRAAVIPITFPRLGINDRTFGKLIGAGWEHLSGGVGQLLSGGAGGFDVTMASGRVMRFDGLFAPWAFLPDFALGFVLLCGIPFTVLAALGIARPARGPVLWGLTILVTHLAVAFAVQTYWPFHALNNYAVFSASLGFYILAAQGMVTISDLASRDAVKVLGISPVRARWTGMAVLGTLILGLIAFTNHHLATGYLIEFRRFLVNAFVNFPYDWDFRVLAW